MKHIYPTPTFRFQGTFPSAGRSSDKDWATPSDKAGVVSPRSRRSRRIPEIRRWFTGNSPANWWFTGVQSETRAQYHRDRDNWDKPISRRLYKEIWSNQTRFDSEGNPTCFLRGYHNEFHLSKILELSTGWNAQFSCRSSYGWTQVLRLHASAKTKKNSAKRSFTEHLGIPGDSMIDPWYFHHVSWNSLCSWLLQASSSFPALKMDASRTCTGS